MKYVQDGVAELRVVEVPAFEGTRFVQGVRTTASTKTNVSATASPGMTKLILNVPVGESTYRLEDGQTTTDLKKIHGFKLHQGHLIVGPYLQLKKGTNGTVATLKVQEGLWEHRRGHKVDGGERRKAEVRFKRNAEKRKQERS